MEGLEYSSNTADKIIISANDNLSTSSLDTCPIAFFNGFLSFNGDLRDERRNLTHSIDSHPAIDSSYCGIPSKADRLAKEGTELEQPITKAL